MFDWVYEHYVEVRRRWRIISLFGLGGVKYILYYKRRTENLPVPSKELKLKYKNTSFKIRVDCTDIFLVETILVGNYVGSEWCGEYYQVENLIKDIGKEDMTILDLGGNIGLFSLLIASKHPNANIILVEPEVQNYKIAKENLASFKKVICLNNGIWSKKCELEVLKRETGEWGFIVQETHIRNEKNIKAISVEEILSKFNILEVDLVKFDIEGSELEVFSSNNLEWIDKCENFVIETHEDIIEKSDFVVNDVMQSRGFKKKQYGENQLFYR